MLSPFKWKLLPFFFILLHSSIAEDSYNFLSPQAEADSHPSILLPFANFLPPDEGSDSDVIAAGNFDKSKLNQDEPATTDDNGRMARNNLVGSSDDLTELFGNPDLGGENAFLDGGDYASIEQSVTHPIGGPKATLYVPWSAAAQDPGPYPARAEGNIFKLASDLQSPVDGRPIMDCDPPIEEPMNAYVVHEITFKDGSQWWRYHHAILVSDIFIPYDIRYDIQSIGRNLKYRKVPNFKFMRNNRITKLFAVERRGWLVGQDSASRQKALEWFESIAKNAGYIRPLPTEHQIRHHTYFWVAYVIRALDRSGSPYWIPDHALEVEGE